MVTDLVLGPTGWVLVSQNRLDVTNREHEVSLAEHSQSWNSPTADPLEEGKEAVEVQQGNVLFL